MKKKSLFRKALSLICCVAMCLTTFIPVIDAAAVDKLTLKLPANMDIYDEYGNRIVANTTQEMICSSYSYTVDADGTVKFYGGDGEKTVPFAVGDEIVLYTDDELQPEIRRVGTKIGVSVEACIDGTTIGENSTIPVKWMMVVEVKNIKSWTETFTTFTITPTLPKYTVTFTSAADCAFMDATGTNALVGGEYTKGDNIQFKLTSVVDGKKAVIYKNGNPANLTPSDEDVYTVEVTGSATYAVKVEDNEYEVTPPTANTAFTYTPNGSTMVSHGGSFSFYVTPAKGYGEVTKVEYTMGASTEKQTLTSVGNNQYLISSVTGSVSIFVTPGTQDTYTVTAPASATYTFTPPTTAVTYNTSATFTINPVAGYKVTSVSYTMGGKVTSLDVATDGQYTIANVTGDVTLTVGTERLTSKIRVVNADNVETTARNGATVNWGEDYDFTVAADAAFDAPEVKVNEGATLVSLGDGKYSVTNITSDVTITITKGGAKTYTVTLIPGTGSTIAPAEGSSTPVHGTDYSFTVNVDEAYSKSKPQVTVNGTPVAATSSNGNIYSYTIKNITEAKTVAVGDLAMNTYKITLTPGAGYTLTAINDTTVSYGDDFSFRLDTDASVSEATVSCTNGATAINDGNGVYTIKNVTSDITVNVTTTAKTLSAEVNNANGDHATVTPVDGNYDNSIPYNGDYSFTVAPDLGYSIAKVSVNGSEITAINGTYTVHGVVRKLTIVVETVENTLTVNYRSTEKNHEYTETKVYTYTELETATLPELNTCDLHTFMGWSDGSGEYVTTLDTKYKDDVAKANVTVNLTAEYTVTEDTIRNLLSLKKTEGEATKLADNTYRITFRTSVGAKDSVDACVRDLVMITKHGTMLANTENVNFANVTFTETSETGIYSGIKGYDGSNEVFLYYVECGYSWDAFNDALVADIAQKTNQIILRVSSVTEKDTLNAAGWVEVKVGDKSFRIISDASGVVTVNSAN